MVYGGNGRFFPTAFREQEVTPPRVILADYHMLVILLVAVILLVHAQVEEARPVKDLAHLSDQLAADALIRVCRNAVPVFAQPGVVGG